MGCVCLGIYQGWKAMKSRWVGNCKQWSTWQVTWWSLNLLTTISQELEYSFYEEINIVKGFVCNFLLLNIRWLVQVWVHTWFLGSSSSRRSSSVIAYAQTIDPRNISIVATAKSVPYIPSSYPTTSSFATSSPTTYDQGFDSSSFNNQTFACYGDFSTYGHH